MRVFRISSLKYPIFSGVGAAFHGGRWNSAGREVIYTSTSLALARLEVLANAGGFGIIPVGLGQVEVDIPEDVTVATFRNKMVPENIAESRRFGDSWLDKERHLMLLVPSMASAGDQNVLINPRHRDITKLEIGRRRVVIWDKRLFLDK